MSVLLKRAGSSREALRFRRLGVSQSQSGQSLVELAFLTPMLLLLMLGVIELGRYAYISIIVGNAARAGAAYGSQGLSYAADSTQAKAEIATAAQNDFAHNGQLASNLTVASANLCACDSSGVLSPDPPTSAYCDIATNASAGTCTSGHWVIMMSVTASGTFNSLFSYPGIPASISLSRTSTLRVKQ